jgi:hypothetical protein
VGWELLLVLVALITLASCQGFSADSQQTETTPPPTTPVTPTPPPTTPVTPTSNTVSPMGSHPISPANWSFECFYCWNSPWITTKAQPGTVRLWQAGTEWAFLNTGGGNYDWSHLDNWLDLIAEQHPTAAIYTFGFVPCWISTAGCDGNGWGFGHNFSPSPPSDLTVSGSPAFTAFVTALVQHCSPAGHCVKNYIKYWEMWNEPDNDNPPYWTGTPTQLYDMFAPVIPIIRNHVPGAKVSTPPMCAHATWMANWMTLENTYGRLSDYYGFHVYLLDYTPEARMGWVQDILDTKNANGWTTTPWMNTETGYSLPAFTCSTQYTAEDCRGQLVRWHVLQYAYQGGGGGAYHVGWFNWKVFSSGGYDTTYYTMMQWLIGASFTTSCTNQGTVWSCPLTEASGNMALIAWDTAGNSQYTPASEYVDYQYFNGTYGGATEAISAGQGTTVGVVPIMFESAQ